MFHPRPCPTFPHHTLQTGVHIRELLLRGRDSHSVYDRAGTHLVCVPVGDTPVSAVHASSARGTGYPDNRFHTGCVCLFDERVCGNVNIRAVLKRGGPRNLQGFHGYE